MKYSLLKNPQMSITFITIFGVAAYSPSSGRKKQAILTVY